MRNVAFWDVDTQADFMLPGGRLYVPGAETIRPNLRKLYAAAKKSRLPVVATADAHTADDAEMKEWPLHCEIGTPGQEKLPETLLGRPEVVRCAPGAAAPRLRPGRQLILEKRELDGFSNPCAKPLVEEGGVDEWVVFGVATDYCVRKAVLGLLGLGCKVTVVSDAVRGVTEKTEHEAVTEMKAAGAEFKTTAVVIRSLAPARAKSRGRAKAVSSKKG